MESSIDNLSELLYQLLAEDNVCVVKLADYFRMLRTLCAGNLDIQRHIGHDKTLLNEVSRAINKGMKIESTEWTLCLRVCCQFLGNLVAMNLENKEIVWKQFHSQLKKMAQRGDSKLTNICYMVIYNILLGTPDVAHDIGGDERMFQMICEAGSDGLEFAQFILEQLCTLQMDWFNIDYSSLSLKARLYLLGLIDGSELMIPTTMSHLLVTYFCKQSDCILSTVADRVNSLEPEEVALILKLLATAFSNPHFLQDVKQEKNLLITCAYLLKSIHLAGKEGNNCFTPVTKLSQTNDELNQHPAFEFKANLVRLLGNLCHKNKENQDKVRELEVIPILLDCCQIDARNPFITQCVVLALRCLCQGNPANQSVIAGLSQIGEVPPALHAELPTVLQE